MGVLTLNHVPSSAEDSNGDAASVDLDQIARLNMPAYRDQWQVVSLGNASFAVFESGLPADEAEELLMAWLKVWKAAIGVNRPAELEDDRSESRVSIGVSSYGSADDLDKMGVSAGKPIT